MSTIPHTFDEEFAGEEIAALYEREGGRNARKMRAGARFGKRCFRKISSPSGGDSLGSRQRRSLSRRHVKITLAGKT